MSGNVNDSPIRGIDAIVADITYIEETDRRLTRLHDETVGPGAAIPRGQRPLIDSDYVVVRDHLLMELGEAYIRQIHYGGK